MLDPKQKIALYAEATMGLINAKMAEGIIRYGRNPITCVIDSRAQGQSVRDLCKVDSDVPIVATLDEAIARGTEVLVLGTTPSGGRIPPEWMAVLDEAIGTGLSVVNGLHDRLNDVYADRLAPGQWIWDIRTPVDAMPPIATAKAAELPNTRVLMIGTDMAVGKKTAGIEIWKSLQKMGQDAVFLPTGQSGMAIMGLGIPLDAYRVDHAAGGVEQMVMKYGAHDYQIIEGQGSLLHPGSTANLPLLRGSCCNAMILVHRAGMEFLDTDGGARTRVPPLQDVIRLYEMVASANGALTPSRVVGIALNTRDLTDEAAQSAIRSTEKDIGLPVTDPVRYSAEPLARAVINAHAKG